MSRLLLAQSSRHSPPWLIFGVRQKKAMTLRISASMAIVATCSTAYAAVWMSRLYSELLKGSPLPPVTEAVIWRGGMIYWLVMPATVLVLYVAGERSSSETRRQRLAESIMILSASSSSLCMFGLILPLVRITVTLSQ